MGCFLKCFGSSKDKKHRKHRKYGSPRRQRTGGQTLVQATDTPVLCVPEKVAYSVSELSDDKSEEQLSSSTRKKVTFDSNVKTYEHVSLYESTDSLLGKNDTSENEVEEKKEDDLARSRQSRTSSEDDSTISSVGSYPQSHRYHNCRDSDDEAVESEYEESDLDDEVDEDDYDEDDDYDDDDGINDGSLLSQEVWSETIPVESKESRTGVSLQRVGSEEVDSPMTSVFPEQEAKTVVLNRNARDRSAYVHPVLNPVENIGQWKAVKSRGTTLLQPHQKENLVADEEVPRVSFSLEPNFKHSSQGFTQQSNQQIKNQNKEMAVDASLSNWLVTPKITPEKNSSAVKLETIASEKSMSQGSTSVMSIEERPILGALTLEELNQFSATSSPRKSPSRSPDDMYIMGTVGTYWKNTSETRNVDSASSYKGIPNTTSKYREDKTVNWHSTPFETRLERALNRGCAES